MLYKLWDVFKVLEYLKRNVTYKLKINLISIIHAEI